MLNEITKGCRPSIQLRCRTILRMVILVMGQHVVLDRHADLNRSAWQPLSIERNRMSTRLFYIDESHDSQHYCLSAISIRHSEWRECLDLALDYRRQLMREHGVFTTKEIHARDFVSGRGRIGSKVIGKHQRTRMFAGFLRVVATLPRVFLFNICIPKGNTRDAQMVAWDRLINRIERTLSNTAEKSIQERLKLIAEVRRSSGDDLARRLSNLLLDYSPKAILVPDEGRERDIERALRRMHVFNPVPSRFGRWEDGEKAKSITVKHIIEDPVFRRSDRSQFIQLADCVAFALLKRESTPTQHVMDYGLHEMFEEHLSGVCFLKASSTDPLGIVRR